MAGGADKPAPDIKFLLDTIIEQIPEPEICPKEPTDAGGFIDFSSYLADSHRRDFRGEIRPVMYISAKGEGR